MKFPATAVTDTHGLIWWITGEHRRLGKRARAFFNAVDRGEAVVCVPAMVLVELDEAITAGDITLSESFEKFVQRLLLTPSRYRLIELDAGVIMAAHGLQAIPERGDRLIAATAVALQYPLVTRDPAIGEAGGVDVVW